MCNNNNNLPGVQRLKINTMIFKYYKISVFYKNIYTTNIFTLNL